MKIKNLNVFIGMFLALLFWTDSSKAQRTNFWNSSKKERTVFADEKKVYEGVKSIQIEASFCDVIVKGEERDNLDFKGKIEGKISKRKEFTIHHQLKGSILNVWIETPNRFVGEVKGILEFKVPKEFDVKVKNSFGDFYCSNLISDHIDIKTTSGDMNFKNMKGKLNLISSSGDVRVDDFVGEIKSVATSGEQEYRKVDGDLICRTTSGDFDLDHINGNIKLKTTSGDLNLEDCKGKIESVSTSGEFRISKSEAVVNIKTSSGDISTYDLKLTEESYFYSSSGEIDVDLQNEYEDLSFDLISSSGDLKVKNHKAEDLLRCGDGKIIVHGNSSSGDQTYRYR
jgi:hypothetical protein